MSEGELAAGTRIGPFRLRTQLGEGGFAPVYLASEEYGGVVVRVVALKIFFPARVGPAVFEQAVSEARSLSRVEHRNVVRYFQIHEDREAGVVGLAMEHVQGESLGARIERSGALAIGETLAVGSAIASALAAVHGAGLVHRDVKPDNVIDSGGVYKLIDFGIATMRRRPGAAGVMPPTSVRSSTSPGPESATDVHGFEDRTLAMATAPRATAGMGAAPAWSNDPHLADTATVENNAGDPIAGTMGYIDPECFKGAPPDSSSDLYALGAMLYECVTGRVPACPSAKSAVLHQAIAFGVERPPRVRDVVPAVPDEVARLIDSLIDPDRARRPRHAEAVTAELDRLRRGVGRARTLPEQGPFRGLDAFDERHRDVFFGRSTDITLALETLRARSLLALVGPSGCGKSSLARAGVVPAIVEGELGGWPPRYVAVHARPGLYPRAAIDAAFAGLFGRGVAAPPPDAFVAGLSARVEAAETGIVLYVDALEELVTVSEPREAEWLASVLAVLARTPVPGLRVVVSARRDFLDRLLAMPTLGAALARSVQLITPLSGRAFAEAVEDRLAVYGYALEDSSMSDELARELSGSPEAMPLFEFALARVWRERDEATHRLTRAALARIGGIAGALEQHAEETLQALVRERGQAIEAIARRVLLALTTPSGTRTRRAIDEILTEARAADPQLVHAVVGAFERARLVVVEDGKLTLAHETLLVRWPRLRDWVASVRKERELLDETERAATRWKARNEDRGLMLRGRALREARELLQTPSVSPVVRAFVQASSSAERRSLTGIVVLVSSVVVGIGVLFGLYRLLESDAREKERTAEEIAGALKKTQNTPEADRVRAIRSLLEEKKSCERELARRTECATAGGADDAGPDAGSAAGGDAN